MPGSFLIGTVVVAIYEFIKQMIQTFTRIKKCELIDEETFVNSFMPKILDNYIQYHDRFLETIVDDDLSLEELKRMSCITPERKKEVEQEARKALEELYLDYKTIVENPNVSVDDNFALYKHNFNPDTRSEPDDILKEIFDNERRRVLDMKAMDEMRKETEIQDSILTF